MQNNSSATGQKHPPVNLPFYYGWFVLALCFLTTLTSAGVRSSPSVLIHPLEAEFGWSRTLIASAVSMNLLLFGVAAPLSGFLIDRFGPRKVMMGSRSEERRVGKECRSRRWPYHVKKKERNGKSC